jgi:hypothetical protein
MPSLEDEFYDGRAHTFASGANSAPPYPQKWAKTLMAEAPVDGSGRLYATDWLTYALRPEGQLLEYVDDVTHALAVNGFAQAHPDHVHLSLLTIGQHFSGWVPANRDLPFPQPMPRLRVDERAALGSPVDRAAGMSDREYLDFILKNCSEGFAQSGPLALEVGGLTPVGNVVTLRLQSWEPVRDLLNPIWENPVVSDDIQKIYPRDPRLPPTNPKGWVAMINVAGLSGEEIANPGETMARVRRTGVAHEYTGFQEAEFSRVVLDRHFITNQNGEPIVDPDVLTAMARGGQYDHMQFNSIPQESITLGVTHEKGFDLF